MDRSHLSSPPKSALSDEGIAKVIARAKLSDAELGKIIARAMRRQKRKRKALFAGMLDRIHVGDALEVMRRMPDACVHCLVTSVPYLWLRNYDTARWEGGDRSCDHEAKTPAQVATALATSTLSKGPKLAATIGNRQQRVRQVCPHCGARRVDMQIGVELDFRDYVAKIVAYLREARRILRHDGTAWIVIGDSYAGSGKGAARDGTIQQDNRGSVTGIYVRPSNWVKQDPAGPLPTGVKRKGLMLIPFRLAIALCEDGWYVRQVIIHHKTACMPESADDRCTTAHEYFLLLTKSPRYFFNAAAIATVAKPSSFSRSRYATTISGQYLGSPRLGDQQRYPNGKLLPPGYFKAPTANARSVWSLPPQPTHLPHYATFPEKLVERCLLAGCPPGGFVLDPFIGTGTTAVVAKRLGMRWIGIELSEKYAKMARRRIALVSAGKSPGQI